MTDVLVAPPTVEPITLTQAKAHLRVTWSSEDTLIAALLGAARAHVELHCTRALVQQSRKLLLDSFPDCIDIEYGPLRAVQSVQYLDEAGVLQTLATDQYRVDKHSRPARITPEYAVTWPTTYAVPNAVIVNYTAGELVPFTADAATDVLTAAGHGLANADISQVTALGTIQTGLAVATNYHVRDATADTLKVAAAAGGAAIDITNAGTPPNALGILPGGIYAALLLVLGHLFNNREENQDFELHEMPLGAERLLAPFRFVRL